MTTTVNLNESKIMKSIIYLLAIGATALTTSFSRAGEDHAARAAVEHAIQVKHVAGVAEYAYDSTGWKPLAAGKVLHAGASVRTGSDATVLLAMEERGALVRVGPMRRLELAKAAPAHETSVNIVPLQAKVLKVNFNAPIMAAK